MKVEEIVALVTKTREELIDARQYDGLGSIFFKIKDQVLTPFPDSLQRAKDKQQELMSLNPDGPIAADKKALGFCDRHPSQHAYCGICEEIRWEEEDMLRFYCGLVFKKDTTDLDELKKQNKQIRESV
jgi:hypothetical protein